MCLLTCQWTDAIFPSLFFQGRHLLNIYTKIGNPFISRVFPWAGWWWWWCWGLHNLQLFKARLLVMNYFVISAVMRFIFNNCYNYIIKKRSHALWLSRQGLKLEGILIKCVILPSVRLALGCPAEMTSGVNNVCVGGKQAVEFTEEACCVFFVLLFICWLTRRDVWKKILMLCIWLSQLIVVWVGGRASSLKCWLFNKRQDLLSHSAWISSWFRPRGLFTQRHKYFLKK